MDSDRNWSWIITSCTVCEEKHASKKLNVEVRWIEMARSKNIYTIYTYIYIYNAIWVPSQHSLPLQELSLRQMGHREWCPPLQLQQPAMLFQLTGHIKRNDLGTCTHLSIIPGTSWLFSSFVLAKLAAMPFPDFCGGNMAVTTWQISSAFHCMITKKTPLIIRYP